MSVFTIKCLDCNHTFYDIVVLCTGEKVEEKCPICSSTNLFTKKMDKSNNKSWAEDEGCYHGDPSKFTHGNKNDGTGSCGACGTGSSGCNCSHSDNGNEELTIDEEIDRRIKSSSNSINTLYLPEHLESELKKPWGEILDKVPLIKKDKPIITVGDVSTKALISKLYTPNLAIIDHKVNRKKIDENDFIPESLFNNSFFFPNPAGQITKRLYQIIERHKWNDTTKHHLIQIDGEEDLATLVCMLHAPIGSHIFYGQPNEGLVHIDLNEKIKFAAEDIFNKFIE